MGVIVLTYIGLSLIVAFAIIGCTAAVRALSLTRRTTSRVWTVVRSIVMYRTVRRERQRAAKIAEIERAWREIHAGYDRQMAAVQAEVVIATAAALMTGVPGEA